MDSNGFHHSSFVQLILFLYGFFGATNAQPSITNNNACDIVLHRTTTLVHNNDDDNSNVVYESSYYAGRSFTTGEQVGPFAVSVSWRQPNTIEYSPWHEVVFHDNSWVSGVGSLAACKTHPNLERIPIHQGETAKLVQFVALRPILKGEPFSMTCGDDDDDDELPHVETFDDTNSVCVDGIQVEKTDTDVPKAIAKRSVSQSDVITTSPMLPFDRSQTDVVSRQAMLTRHGEEHFVFNNTNVVGIQPILQYCFGHPDSNLLLLPLDSSVHSLRHSSSKGGNVGLQWKTSLEQLSSENRLPPTLMELYEDYRYSNVLIAEFVALRDIVAGEELKMDFGTLYSQAVQTNDPFLLHERRVPEGFFPSHWMRQDSQPFGDFQAHSLTPGQIEPIRWSHHHAERIATSWAFRVGLPPSVRRTLLEYCHLMGITRTFRRVTVEGNPLFPGQQRYQSIPGAGLWYLQRPTPQWRSNMHWFSPGDAEAHEHYLQALSAAGFDETLKSLGEYFDMDGLVAFHITFIAVSFSNKGYMHHDVSATGGKSFNLIIPLLLANETGPELDIQDEQDEDLVGRYRYEYDVAIAVGDDAFHGTSAVDYRFRKEMRLAATVYVADVNEDNAETILNHYTQAYPPRDLDLLKSWIADHWKRGDPTRALPKPGSDHILLGKDDDSSNEEL